MTSNHDEQLKTEFMNIVVDITSKINSAVDDLIFLTDHNTGYFSKSDAENVLKAIENISLTTSLILTKAIDAIVLEQALPIKHSVMKYVVQLGDELGPDLISKLPDVAIEVIAAIGISSAIKLFKAFGGTTFPIGKGIRYLGGSRAKDLRTVLTENEVKKLTQYFAGTVLYLPRCDRVLREVRNQAFIRDFNAMRQSGASALQCMCELPLKYGFTDRYGWQLLKNERESKMSNVAPD